MTPVAAAVMAFNLICSGQETNDLDPSVPAKPFSIVYRVDLRSERYCSRDCPATSTIAHTTVSDLVLEDREAPELPLSFHIRIFRESGDYVATFKSSAGSFHRLGACRKATFTGFPRQKF